MHPENPYARAEISTALESVEAEVASFFGSLSAEEMVLRVGTAWTALEHLMHLNTSVSAVARGLSAPRWLLRLRFGRARGGSRTYEQIRETYLAALAGGGGATGVFVPDREELSTPAAGERAGEVLARWARVNERLRGALQGWSERDLDRLRLPHPLLGKITSREMLFFTLYHDQHHIAAAKRRLPRFGAHTDG